MRRRSEYTQRHRLPLSPTCTVSRCRLPVLSPASYHPSKFTPQPSSPGLGRHFAAGPHNLGARVEWEGGDSASTDRQQRADGGVDGEAGEEVEGGEGADQGLVCGGAELLCGVDGQDHEQEVRVSGGGGGAGVTGARRCSEEGRERYQIGRDGGGGGERRGKRAGAVHTCIDTCSGWR